VDRSDRNAWQNWQRRNQAIVDSVQTALRDERLLFAFQPVVCAATGRIDYYECLLRMRDEERGLVTCGEFVEAIEQVGLIGLIDRYVVRKVAEELAGHSEVRLGLNVSGLTACDREWLRSVIALLQRRPDLARRLVVEITETATLDNLAESVRFVDALRDIGCRVALDDFGAGHTSLRHLQVLAVDTIKIDGSFVRSLPSNNDSRIFLRHLLGLARDFGLHTVGECVETAEEAALLRAEGIGFLQGFHCGRPTIARHWLGETAGACGACE
jgi:EAL domain-containing protein (putative c-di-GMP-specific phosphodiesterase class I)